MEVFIGMLSGIGIALGLGGSTILTLFLTLALNIEQYNAQFISLISFFLASFISCIYNFKKGNISFKNCIIIICTGILGAIIGSISSSKFNVLILKKLFGCFILLIAVYEFKSLYLLIKNKKSK